jgi:hypothetical protein
MNLRRLVPVPQWCKGMGSLKMLLAVSTLSALLMLTFLLCGSRGQGELTGIRYIQTDKSIYEVGQTVNVTAAWYIDYSGGFECSEGVISCLRRGSTIGASEWSNEQQGFHIHQASFSLDPNAWCPCEVGENGTAESLLSLPMDVHYQTAQLDTTFRVIRARQNCSLIDVTPSAVVANVSTISLSLRWYNANNASFGVDQNPIFYSITNPAGCVTVLNNCTTTDASGGFVISINPNFMYGDYSISLRSSENQRYLNGYSTYNLTVGRSPIPTQLDVNWTYVGDTRNSTQTYALEPVDISARLARSNDNSGISNQQIEFSVFDTSSLKQVFQSEEMTNVSGFATDSLILPHEGSFVLKASYGGLYGTWLPSLDSSIRLMKASTRELTMDELVGFPSVISLGHEYHVRYVAVDVLSKCPVSNISIVARADNLTLANNSTDSDGIVELGICVPVDRWDLVGNLTLSIEAPSSFTNEIYTGSSISRHLLCKIPTVTTLNISPRDMVQDGETIQVSAQLQTFNFTPISAMHVTFTAFLDQKSGILINVTGITDAQGLCTISLKMPASGSLTIAANFNGSSVFDNSSGTLSTSIFPEFFTRLSSSIPSTLLILLLSLTSILFVRKRRRKTSWHRVTVP